MSGPWMNPDGLGWESSPEFPSKRAAGGWTGLDSDDCGDVACTRRETEQGHIMP